jgi:hypothetical protein
MKKFNIQNVNRRLLVLSMVALSACSTMPQWMPHMPSMPWNHQASHKENDSYAANFTTSLSSAVIKLEHGGTLDDISEDTDVIKIYTARTHAKPARITVAVLDYHSDNEKHKIIIPLDRNLHSVSDITYELSKSPYTLSDISVVNVKVSAGSPIKIKKQDSAALLQSLKARQQTILASATKLPTLDDARQQLALLRFFIDHQQQDGAYLCADNAKRLLATAAHNDQDMDMDNQLTQELNDLEGRLREEMPY